MKYSKLLFLLLLMFSLISAQTINLEEFIDQLKTTHPIFESEELSAQIALEEKNSLSGTEDWNIFGSVGIAHTEPSYAFMEPKKTDALAFGGGAERLYWKTGGRLVANFSSSFVDIGPSSGYPDPSIQNQVDISYFHPLMKNKNGFLDRLHYELKQFDIDFSEIKAKENLEDFILNVSDKFLDWVFLFEQETITAERIKLSEEQLARTIKKKEAHLVDQVDVIRAEDAVRFWEQYLVSVESRRAALQAELSVLVNKEDLKTSNPSYDLYVYSNLSSLEEINSQLMNNSRIIQALKIRINQLEFSKNGIVEMAKPDLSLVAGASLKNLDEVYTESLIMDKPSVSLGAQFSFPLGNTATKYDLRKTDLQIAQFNKQLIDVSITLSSALNNLYTQINDLEQILKLNEELITSSKERTEEEMKLYDQGRGDLTFVIMSRDNEQNAKLTYAQNSIMYHKLMLQYKALTDQLFD